MDLTLIMFSRTKNHYYGPDPNYVLDLTLIMFDPNYVV